MRTAGQRSWRPGKGGAADFADERSERRLVVSRTVSRNTEIEGAQPHPPTPKSTHRAAQTRWG
jgi:hypothetical protein